MLFPLRLVIAASLLVASSDVLYPQECSGTWSPAYGDMTLTDGGEFDQGDSTSVCVHDEGAGPALYLSGRFRWSRRAASGSASQYRAVTSFFSGAYKDKGDASPAGFGEVVCSFVDGQGSGVALAIGDQIHVERDGMWSVLPGVLELTPGVPGQPYVRSLTSIDDGSGPALYVSGFFQAVDGVAVWNIARFDGVTWSAFGPGLGSEVYALHVNDFGLEQGAFFAWGEAEATLTNGVVLAAFTAPSIEDGRPAVYFGGDFAAIEGIYSSGIAEYSRLCSIGDSDCFGAGESTPGCTACPCSNDAAPDSEGGCANVSGAGSRLLAEGIPSVAADSLRFTLVDMPQLTSGILFSGDQRLPANPSSPCFGQHTGIANAGDGIRCMGLNGRRNGTRESDASGNVGTTNAGWGVPDGPASGVLASSGFVVGQTRHFQVLHRDSAVSGCGSGLNSSNGVSLTFSP